MLYPMITSSRNPKIQLVRDLLAHPKARYETKAFVVEGVRLIEEAWRAGWSVRLVLCRDDLSARGRNLADQFIAQGIPVEQVVPSILEAVSDTQTSQGILAVVNIRPLPLPPRPDFLLILDGVRDPGNLGTILRTASAAGVQAALLPPGVTDPYAPKVVRSAMGAHFRLPIHSSSWPDIRAYLCRTGEALSSHALAETDFNRPMPRPNVYLADAQGELCYTQADFRSPLALVIGGEAEGAGAEAQALTDYHVHIPMPGGAESLNAAVAAAILLFEVVRQRSKTANH
jgi:TrmH family RNA methyltransferase